MFHTVLPLTGTVLLGAEPSLFGLIGTLRRAEVESPTPLLDSSVLTCADPPSVGIWRSVQRLNGCFQVFTLQRMIEKICSESTRTYLVEISRAGIF